MRINDYTKKTDTKKKDLQKACLFSNVFHFTNDLYAILNDHLEFNNKSYKVPSNIYNASTDSMFFSMFLQITDLVNFITFCHCIELILYIKTFVL